MEKEAVIETAKIGDDATLTSSDGKNEKVNKFDYREKRIAAKEQKRSDYERKLRSMLQYSYGASCDDTICTSCKIIIQEFGKDVLHSVEDSRFVYVRDLTKEFCAQDRIYGRYNIQLFDICTEIMTNNTFRDMVVGSFDQTDMEAKALLRDQHKRPGYNPKKPKKYWDFIEEYRDEYLHVRQMHVCNTIRACRPSQFSNQLKPHQTQTQSSWNGTCLLCRAMARDLEARLMLEKVFSENTVVQLVLESCLHVVSD